MEKILAPLFKNTPLALAVIGLLLILIGATGGIEKLSLVIESLPWRIVMAGMGIVVAAFAALLIWRESKAEEPSADARKYGLKITATETVGSDVKLEGSYRKKPPDGSVVIVERALATGDHYLQAAPYFDEKTSKWSGQYRIGSGERVLTIGILGKSAQALRDYYLLVGRQTTVWTGIKVLPPDLTHCDNVSVKRK
jgi:hypothetical protein